MNINVAEPDKTINYEDVLDSVYTNRYWNDFDLVVKKGRNVHFILHATAITVHTAIIYLQLFHCLSQLTFFQITFTKQKSYLIEKKRLKCVQTVIFN